MKAGKAVPGCAPAWMIWPLWPILASLAAQHAVAQTVCATPAATILSKQWAQLRKLPGHFDGAPWQDRVDKYGGEKYCVLEAMRRQAVQSKPERAQFEQMFGAADPITREELPCNSAAPHFTWYSWRGRHDGLLLEWQANKVGHTLKNAVWCQAGE